MGIKTNLNISPYFDDYNIAKKYYRVLFRPGYAVQARELTQLQTTLQNQIEQFGENIYKEGSIIKGCTFTELNSLRYVKLVDDIQPEDYIERTEISSDGLVTDEYYYELEDANGLKAIILQAQSGFQSRNPDLNTFFISYLNTVEVGGFEKKEYEQNDTLQIKEYIIRSQEVNGVVEETTIENGVVATTSVSNLANSVGRSFGLTASEGIVFQRGHFLFVDEQTIVVVKYLDESTPDFETEPNNVSVGYIVDESIVTSQQDLSLLDNSIGSPNQNAPGANRLLLVPRLVSRDTTDAESDSEFFILRRYENGTATQTRDVSQFNSIAEEMARRTYEAHGDFTKKPFKYKLQKRESDGSFFIEMSEGTSYSKGYRISNNTKRFFNVPQINSTSVIQNQPINIIDGGFCPVISNTGSVTIGSMQTVSLLDSTDAVIGTAIVKNYTPDRLYLFAIRMNTGETFTDVQYVKEGSSSGQIEISPSLINSSESRLIYPLNRPFIESIDNISFSVRRSKTAVPTDGSGILTIEPSVGNSFTADSLRDVLVISASNTKATISDVSINGAGNLVVTTNSISENVIVFYNEIITDAQPRLKQELDIFIKTEFSSGVSKYTLGVPDAIDLLSVKVMGDVDDIEYKDSFKLVSNQKDNFYDHSYIEAISGRPSPNNTDILLVKVKVFRVDSSSDINFFTIDSYTGVDFQKIQIHEAQTGELIDLRNSVDFRPYRTSLVSYSATEAGATTLSSTSTELPVSSQELFSSSINHIVPSVNTSGIADISYYNKRIDYIVASSYGRFRYIVGDESNSSANKLDNSDISVIAEVQIPGFPLLSQEEAFRLNKRSETVKILPKTVQTYTMKDIDNISKRVDKLVYYTVLSALENSTKNLLIQDENGLNRFKNGIIVDPFNDLSIAETTNPNFKASIDSSEKALYPAVKQFPMDLRIKAFNNTQSHDVSNKVISLTSETLTPFIRQQYATNFRNCVSDFYNYKGVGYVTPEYDVAYDTVQAPPYRLDIDLASPFADFTDALSEFIPLTSTQSSVLSTTVERTTTGRTITTDTTQQIQDITSSLQQSTIETEEIVGDFVTNIQFDPFIRSVDLQIEMYGLRPNTRHWFFFDGQDVNDQVAPGVFFGNLTGVQNDVRVVQSGAYGSEVKSDSNGELFAVFRIPENRFIVGERELFVVDVSSFGSIDSASISGGKVKYNAYNFNIDKTGITVSTRQPSFDVEVSTSNHTVTTRTQQIIPRPIRLDDNGGDNFGNDPLSQTFFVKESATQGGDSLYVGRVDLFFKRKSPTNGVSIQIREVVNGYPTAEIIPFANKILKPEDVEVSDDSSAVTSVFFDAPIRLDAEKEYALVIQPMANDPDYIVFTSKVGETDLISGAAINSDWGDGVLFTSTNNRAWKSYQDEDVKFTLYRHKFSVSEGTVELETKDQEFFTLQSTIGRFSTNELVYAFKGVTTYPMTANTATNTITGTGLNNYDVGDYFYLEGPSSQVDLLKVLSINPAGTEIVANRPPLFSGSSLDSAPVVVGKVNYYSPRETSFIALESSSARANRVFEVGDTIRGFESGARSEIVSIDNIELSYIQAMINRIIDSDTDVKISVKAIDPLNVNNVPYTSTFDFSNKKTFNEKGAVIFSKSNDIDGLKNLRFILTLSKTPSISTPSPIVDAETAKIFAYIYKITDDPSTTSKYLSKKVELQEGFDSEDFRLYLTGYRPKGTDIKVYLKVKNSADPVSLTDNNWIELEKIEGADLFSSVSNLNDYKEFVYEIPESAKTIGGILTYTNETGTYETYRSFSIRVDLLSDSVGSVPKLLDYRGIAFE